MFALTTAVIAIMSLVSVLSFITHPEGNIDPNQAWTIPALTVLFAALTLMFYKQNKKRQLTKADTAN